MLLQMKTLSIKWQSLQSNLKLIIENYVASDENFKYFS